MSKIAKSMKSKYTKQGLIFVCVLFLNILLLNLFTGTCYAVGVGSSNQNVATPLITLGLV